MAKTKISEFSTTAGNNTDINSINIAEGCSPSGINDAIRELMRQLKEFQTGGAGDSVNSGGDFSVATNKFTVASASGNTSVAGTLGVTGAATLSSTLAVTGTTTLTGALVANGNATLGDGSGDTVTVKGTPTLEVNPTLSGGTANGVAYLNGSKVLTTGSALTFTGSNLGVGIATALQRLHVYESTAATGAFLQTQEVGGQNAYFGVNTSGGSIQVAGANPLQFAINGSEQMRLTSTGLGIGTSSPAQKLNVNGIALFEGSAQGNVIIQKTGTNGVSLFSDAAGKLAFYDQNAGVTRLTLDSSGNLGLGVTPSAWNGYTVIQMGAYANFYNTNGGQTGLATSAYNNSTNWIYNSNNPAFRYEQDLVSQSHRWFTAPSGTAGNAITFTQAMTLDSSGNLLVGTTGQTLGTARLCVSSSGLTTVSTTSTSAESPYASFNTATSGNNQFMWFYTGDSGQTFRGSIEYNRGAGLVVYNTTSDYRAKDISGPVTGSGALIDSVPVYMGTMKGATQERPMFLAHETPDYVHMGEKDAVDADGNPVYQRMDASALIPVMWAEIQSLRKRLAAAGI